MTWLGALGLLFIGLKLASVIAWSWWLVLLPLYGGAVVVFGIAAVGFLGVTASQALNGGKRRVKARF